MVKDYKEDDKQISEIGEDCANYIYEWPLFYFLKIIGSAI